MAGTQYERAKTAGTNLKKAKEALRAAEKAPHTGSASTKALNEAKSIVATAQSNFDSLYREYVADATKHDKGASYEQPSYFA